MTHTPRSAYRLMLRRFGPRGWWPVTPRGSSRPRYRPGRYGPPGGEKAALEVCLGAILTQNTAWTNVEKALESLHRARAVSVPRLLRMRRTRLERLIRPSGYFSQKAGRLKGFLRRAPRPLARWLKRVSREELLAVKGIGPETADSILLYAAGRPAFVVDAYTRRIGARLGWYGDRAGYDEVQAHLTVRLPRSVPVYQEMHALLVELAKRHCRTAPACAGCPLSGGCRSAR